MDSFKSKNMINQEESKSIEFEGKKVYLTYIDKKFQTVELFALIPILEEILKRKIFKYLVLKESRQNFCKIHIYLELEKKYELINPTDLNLFGISANYQFVNYSSSITIRHILSHELYSEFEFEPEKYTNMDLELELLPSKEDNALLLRKLKLKMQQKDTTITPEIEEEICQIARESNLHIAMNYFRITYPFISYKEYVPFKIFIDSRLQDEDLSNSDYFN